MKASRKGNIVFSVMYATHSFPSCYDSESRILILGSFPSVVSREEGFYYAHRSNRFWPVMESLFSVSLKNIEDKKTFLHSHHIALWDVVSECEITSSSDASIRSVVPNDIEKILMESRVERIFVNGSKAYELLKRYNIEKIWRAAVKLPSTSSANASFSFSRLLDEWSAVKTSLELS